MPFYVFKCPECGRRSTERRTMSEAGDPLTCQCGGQMRRDYCGEHGGQRSGEHGWPMYSDSASIEPEQIASVTDRMRSCGIRCEFDREGRPKFENPSHRRKCLKFFGLIDKNSFY